MADVTIDGQTYEFIHIPTKNTGILIIKTPNGFLGCGYLDVQVANRVGDAAAIVTGVASAQQMLDAKVVRMSEKAKELGVQEGMTGLDAIRLLK